MLSANKASPSSPPSSKTYQTHFDQNVEYDTICKNLEDVNIHDMQFFPLLIQTFMTSPYIASSFMPPPHTSPLYMPPTSMPPPSSTEQGSGSRTKSCITNSRKQRGEENTIKKIGVLTDDIY